LGVRLLVLVVLSVALMVVDARFALLKPVRSQMSLVLMQTYWITDLPQRLYQGVASQFGSRTELVAENEKLKTENLLLQGRMQKLAALTEQNVRLRELLNSSALVNEKVEVAELIGMDSLHGPRSDVEPWEVRLRVAARCEARSDAVRVGNEVETLYTNGPSGGGGASKSVRQVVAVASLLLARSAVNPRIEA